jgi:hypothetical protein
MSRRKKNVEKPKRSSNYVHFGVLGIICAILAAAIGLYNINWQNLSQDKAGAFSVKKRIPSVRL